MQSEVQCGVVGYFFNYKKAANLAHTGKGDQLLAVKFVEICHILNANF